MAGNRLSDMAGIVEDLDAMGRLIRVRSEVDPHLELAGVAARSRADPARCSSRTSRATTRRC